MGLLSRAIGKGLEAFGKSDAIDTLTGMPEYELELAAKRTKLLTEIQMDTRLPYQLAGEDRAEAKTIRGEKRAKDERERVRLVAIQDALKVAEKSEDLYQKHRIEEISDWKTKSKITAGAKLSFYGFSDPSEFSNKLSNYVATKLLNKTAWEYERDPDKYSNDVVTTTNAIADIIYTTEKTTGKTLTFSEAASKFLESGKSATSTQPGISGNSPTLQEVPESAYIKKTLNMDATQKAKIDAKYTSIPDDAYYKKYGTNKSG